MRLKKRLGRIIGYLSLPSLARNDDKDAFESKDTDCPHERHYFLSLTYRYVDSHSFEIDDFFIKKSEKKENLSFSPFSKYFNLKLKHYKDISNQSCNCNSNRTVEN